MAAVLSDPARWIEPVLARVRQHYVQWAKFPEELQLECVGNAFLDGDERLAFTQRRCLAGLGFSSPSGEVPNYFRRYSSKDELAAAAELAVRVVEEVLDEGALEAQAPDRGHVCVVVPVGKCRPDVLASVVGAMLGPLSVRRQTTCINAYGAGEPTGQDVLAWLHDGEAEEQPGTSAGPRDGFRWIPVA